MGLGTFIQFTAGDKAVADDVNHNFDAITTWANHNVTSDNLGTLTNTLQFNVSSNVNAISIANSGNLAALLITQNDNITIDQAIITIDDSTITQTEATAAEFRIKAKSSSTIPAIWVTHAAVDTFKLTKDSLNLFNDSTKISSDRIRLPVKTTIQRNAIVSPEEGSLLYNSTEKNLAIYNGTSWVPPVKVDGTSLEYSSEIARIKDSGVTTAKIANLNVTRAKLELLGQQQQSAGSQSTSSTSFVTTGLSQTITTTGRPVLISFNSQYISAGSTVTNVSANQADIEIRRNGAALQTWTAQWGVGGNLTSTFYYPISLIWVDVIGAGTYTYEFFWKRPQGTAAATLGSTQLTIFEL